MAAATGISFFNPSNLVGGSFTIQSNSPSYSASRASALSATGDESANALYGAKTSETLTLKSTATTGNLSLTSLLPGTTIQEGSTGEYWHIDSVAVKYSPTDYPEITVSLHIHNDCETSIHSHATSHRKPTGNLTTLPAGFGCPDSALKTIVGASSETKIGISGFSYTIALTHQDEAGSTGGYLASENRDAVETIQVDFVGVPGDEPSPTGWDCTSHTKPKSNTTANTSSYSFERHLATATPVVAGGTNE